LKSCLECLFCLSTPCLLVRPEWPWALPECLLPTSLAPVPSFPRFPSPPAGVLCTPILCTGSGRRTDLPELPSLSTTIGGLLPDGVRQLGRPARGCKGRGESDLRTMHRLPPSQRSPRGGRCPETGARKVSPVRRLFVGGGGGRAAVALRPWDVTNNHRATSLRGICHRAHAPILFLDRDEAGRALALGRWGSRRPVGSLTSELAS